MSKFTQALERHWPSSEWTISVGCLGAQCEHADGDENHSCEASFSSAACDSCGSRLGGDRAEAWAIHREAFGPNAKRLDEMHQIQICVDCMMYHANGDEPETWEG